MPLERPPSASRPPDEPFGFSGEVDRNYYGAPSELYLLNVGPNSRTLKLRLWPPAT